MCEQHDAIMDALRAKAALRKKYEETGFLNHEEAITLLGDPDSLDAIEDAAMKESPVAAP